MGALLRLHDLARPAAVAFSKLEEWPAEDSFVRALAFRNFAQLLVGDAQLAADFFGRIAEYSTRLTEKAHLAVLGALASPTRMEMVRILDENR